ncbi:unnamed protein product [Pleuronectes platessa]|uniref:Uncharacterized protein n=1 Tax=Pleuronectes platessa TaxID=8262 RepID=A0A9N7VI36_PLEPL|nr:unnamed protein product [Pleuronectes platessa]
MTVMVVVIICLLNHYKLSNWSLITRQSQAHRHNHALQQNSTTNPSGPGDLPFCSCPIASRTSAAAIGAPSLSDRLPSTLGYERSSRGLWFFQISGEYSEVYRSE